MAGLVLKKYQEHALEALTVFLRAARERGAKAAFEDSGYGYSREPFGEVPCVCLRIPTGGGKTLLASHAIVRMAKEWLETRADAPTALWLTPSDTIRSQTLKALQTPGHPYREALENAYGQRFQICDLENAVAISPHDWGRQAVIVVATIQSFRIEETGLRNVYAFSETNETHFKSKTEAALRLLYDIPDALVTPKDAEKNPMLLAHVGKPKQSLANWLALQNPFIIVDEAHNTKTERSFEALKRLNPAVILELTATPIPKKSNILYHVSAQELQAEHMIKLPIVLMEHPQGPEAAIFDAVQTQRKLEAEAQKEADYLRPIVLFQAQNANETMNVDALRKHLIEELHIPEAHIAVATGSTRELEDVDLLDARCPVRYIITVQALREGWDCPFAYVLCSAQPVRSATAVEQLLGRVLRMPYARRRASEALNKAYAHVSEAKFGEAANALADRLIQGMGFEALDVASMIAPQLPLPGMDDGPLFANATPLLELAVDLPAKAEIPASEQVRVETTDKGKRAVVTGHVSDSLAQRLTEAQRGAAAKEKVARAIEQHNAVVAAQLAPVSRGVVFAPVPRLCYSVQGELLLEEREAVLEEAGIDLLADTISLPGFQIVEQANAFEVYLDGAKVRVGQADTGQLQLDTLNTTLTEDDLVRWLDREVRQPDIVQSHLRAYLKAVIAHMVNEQHLTLVMLARARYQLARGIASRIEDMRVSAAGRQFRQLVLDGGWDIKADLNKRFEFLPGNYAVSATDRYRGKWRFDKHYYPVQAKLEDGSEEFKCAVVIDGHPKVKQWVRNLERDVPGAFWLPVSRGRFFPDFICELTDGRILVIEYKGAHLRNLPSEIEKDEVGRLWARKSEGKCLFLFTYFNESDMDVRQQIDKAIG